MGRLGSLALILRPVSEAENTEFKPTELKPIKLR